MRKMAISLFVFFALCCLPVSADISIKDIDWGRLDASLNQLEANLIQLEADNETLRKWLAEERTYSANQSIQLATLRESLSKSKSSISRWRISFGVATGVALATTAILLLRR